MGWLLQTASTRKPEPWKNGKGTCYDVARKGATGTDFEWELGTAEICNDAPFSNYPGVSRVFAVANEDGVIDLTVNDNPPRRCQFGLPFAFDGGAVTSARLVEGAGVTAVNLLFKTALTAKPRLLALHAHTKARLIPHCCVAIVAIGAAGASILGVSKEEGSVVSLGPLDALVWRGDDGAHPEARLLSGSVLLLVLDEGEPDRAKEQLVRHRRSVKHTSPLLRYARNVTSQGGEDGIVFHVLELILATELRRERLPVLVDIGSWDGRHWSNSYSLLNGCIGPPPPSPTTATEAPPPPPLQMPTPTPPEDCSSPLFSLPWRGLLVEADAIRDASAKELYAANANVACLCSLVSSDTLPSLLRQQNIPHNFELLSIDVDSTDYHLLRSLQPTPYRPKLIIIEFNPTIPNSVSFVQADLPGQHKGSSLRAIAELGREMGYNMIVCTTWNAFLVLDSLCPLLRDDFLREECLDTLLFKLHAEEMSTSMFQCYDGELKYAGVLKLLWANPPRSINPQQLQVLKRKEMVFSHAPNCL